MTGTIQVLQDDYRPAADAVLTTTLRTPTGTSLPVQHTPTGNPGEFRYSFRTTDVGVYNLEAQATLGTTTQVSNRTLLHVYRPGAENQQAAPNHDLLRDIADRTRGAFFALSDPKRPTPASLVEFWGGTTRYKVLEEKRLRLRETLALFLVILGCFALEWWWRRRVGLL